ncbi:MAG: HAD family hydrolase [Pirellulaceae bacterium]
MTQKPLLILDLDETLIFGSERPLHRDADFRVGPFYLYKRPYVDKFLTSVARVYDVALWSSASEDYVDGIARSLIRNVGEWRFVWGRSRCIPRMNPETFDTNFIKDLRKVKRRGFDLNQVLIVDDTPGKVCRNFGNAIYVLPFEGQDDDNELKILDRYLHSLHSFPDFRKLEKRGWRTRHFGGPHAEAR